MNLMKTTANGKKTSMVCIIAALLCSGALLASQRNGTKSLANEFSDHALALVESTHVDFGIVPVGTELHHQFAIENRGGQRLVLNVDDCHCGDTPSEHLILMPGDQKQISVSMTVRPQPSNQQQTIAMTTNDPQNPRIELRITAQTPALAANEVSPTPRLHFAYQDEFENPNNHPSPFNQEL